MNTATAGILGIILLTVFATVSIGFLICYIRVLVALFKREGVGLGILGILCSLYPYIWGWIKSAELGLRKVMIWWTGFLVVLVGMWCVVLAGMVGIASNPVWKKALERELNAQQASYDQLAMMKSMNNVKQLCVGCITWAEDHQGNFPAELDDLFVDKYLGADKSRLMTCPLLRDSSKPNYLYQGKNFTATSPGSTSMIVSAWTEGHGKHIVGHKDGSVSLETVKQRQSARKAGSDANTAKQGQTAAAPLPSGSSSPAPAIPQPAPSATPPPEAPFITLSNEDRQGRLIHRVVFPSEQMPANTDHYYWVVEFPDHEIKVKPLRLKAPFWMAPPKTSGTFKVSIEYREGDLKRAASNTVDLIVP